MPVYTCTTTIEVIDRGTKRDLAAEITRIHAEINQVPTTYVNVASTRYRPKPYTATLFRRCRC